MPSSKGKPTDPELREKIKEEIKDEPNKDGGGKGQWSAWKATKLSKEYEKKGGSYENEAGSKNEPKKGAPQPKSSSKKKAEEKKKQQNEEGSSSPAASGEKENGQNGDDESDEEAEEKPKANTSKKASVSKEKGFGEKTKEERAVGRPKKSDVSETPKKVNAQTEGTRKSARVAEKRKGGDEDEGGKKKSRK
ncbi:hypothetical protein DM02DRAFT_714948 [Periconia macrospinosa]|uniref:Hypervirulence associated protein TUDOR domain-containing protein n=1 Tax=Periconia macrospinosa TaxID=97972 RepID=A0A2V1E893_9PLEO|nr:hypothetical protein DM02DRAFT_714948 [Periconia macrospinosa]